jgi:AcrR family transcriptional regulator
MTSESSQRPLRRDAEENRLALLNAAIVALGDDADASLEAIAAAAGLSRRAVYGHFANRDELVAAAIERGAVRLTAATADVERSDARVSLALLGSRLWDAVEQMRAMASLAVRGPSITVVATALAPVRSRLRTIVEAGVADGTLRRDVPPASLSRLIEQAAIAVLLEATSSGLTREEGHRLVMLMALSTGGLSWRAAAALIDATPELGSPPAGQADRIENTEDETA